MTTFLLIAVVVAVIGYKSLLRKIENLQERIKKLENWQVVALHVEALKSSSEPTAVKKEGPQPSPTSSATVYSAPPVYSTAPVPAPQSSAVEQKLPVQPARVVPPAAPSAWQQTTDSILQLIKKNPFATAGVLMLLIGVGFLFSLLAANNILPPVVRVMLVAIAGAGVFGLGLRLGQSKQVLGLNLQGGALALEYLCILWAHEGYGLITAPTAFVCLGALSTLAFGWAVRTDRVLFAFIGLTGALLTPIIASTGEGDFSSLSLYAGWVGLLSIAVGVRIGAPSLVSAALAGTSALLGAAMSLAFGSQSVLIAALVAMAAAYGISAFYFMMTRSSHEWSGSHRVSIVSILTGSPLIMAGFLYTKANVSAGWCAVLIGIVGIACIAQFRRSTLGWRGTLLAIGGGLTLVAIGVGLEGASRAIALAASALGFILIAQEAEKRWAQLGALLYWVLSVIAGFHAWHSGTAGVTPLVVSGLVALGAGFMTRNTNFSLFYPLCAPLVLGVAVLQHIFSDPIPLLVWFLAWATLATVAGTVLRWVGLRLSAYWLLFAGWSLFASNPSDTSMSAWVIREMLLIAWIAGSALLLRWYRKDDEAPVPLNMTILSFATLAIPLLCNIELSRFLDAENFSGQILIAGSILLWSIWSVCAKGLTAITDFDWQPMKVSVIAETLIVFGILFAHPSVITELSQWIGVSLLLLAWVVMDSGKEMKSVYVWGLAGAVLIGSLLRSIGTGHGLDDGALELIFTRVMQPWVSLLWAAGGMAVVVMASRYELRQQWVAGGIALAILVGKMFFVDLSALTLVGKVGVFLAVGIVFIGLGFFCPLPPEPAPDKKAV